MNSYQDIQEKEEARKILLSHMNAKEFGRIRDFLGDTERYTDPDLERLLNDDCIRKNQKDNSIEELGINLFHLACIVGDKKFVELALQIANIFDVDKQSTSSQDELNEALLSIPGHHNKLNNEFGIGYSNKNTALHFAIFYSQEIVPILAHKVNKNIKMGG